MRTPRLVSVIVPSYNAGPQLGAQLAAIRQQDYSGAVEVIVADNGCDRGRLGAAALWADAHPTVRFVDASARRGPGAARNAGVAAAGGDLLAFCDADDEVSTAWLSMMVTSAAEADLVGGSLDTSRLNSPLLCACYELTDPAEPHLDFLPTAAGANLGIWADVLAALGGFDERSRTGEDVSLVWTAQLRGYTYVPSPALVHKRLPSSLTDAARRFFHYGVGDVWLYREFRSAGMPRRDRASTNEVLAALGNGFAGSPPLERRIRWNFMMALTCGRLVGSVRYRVLFT